MKIAALDVETSMKPIMHPYQAGSYLSMVGLYYMDGTYKEWVFNHDEAPANTDMRKNIREIRDALDDLDLVVGHNIKFDLMWMKELGINIHNFKVWCTMVTHYIQRGQRFNKRELSLSELSIYHGITEKIDKVKHYWQSGINTHEIPMKVLSPYLCQDCMNALSIYKNQHDLMMKQKYQRKLIMLHNEVSKELTDIEWNGMQINEGRMEDYIQEYEEKLDIIYSRLRDHMSYFNGRTNMKRVDFTKSQNLSAALYGGILKYDDMEDVEYERWATRKVPTGNFYKSGAKKGKEIHRNERYREKAVRTRKCVSEVKLPGCGFTPPKGSDCIDSQTKEPNGYFSTDKNLLPVLKKGANHKQKRIITWLEERSNVKKVLETFRGKTGNKGLITKVMPDGRVHPNYNQTVTKTGRLSSSNPNGQNFPRGGTSPLKKIFVSRYKDDGYILVADLAQLEWRVAACLSQDPTAINEIVNNLDYHTENAVNLFGSKSYRQDAKILGFRLLYGGTPYAFFMDQKMPNKSLKEWSEIVERYYLKYNLLAAWQADLFRNVGMNVETELTPGGDEIVWGTYIAPTGRKYKFRQQPIKKMAWAMGFKDTQVKNFQVQGTATGDIMPLAMVVAKKRLRAEQLKGRLLKVMDIGQVHDSIIFDCHKDHLREMSDLMIQVYEDLPFIIAKWFGIQWNVPLTGDCTIGKDYGRKDFTAERKTIGSPTIFEKAKSKPEKLSPWTVHWSHVSGHWNAEIFSPKELEKHNASIQP